MASLVQEMLLLSEVPTCSVFRPVVTFYSQVNDDKGESRNEAFCLRAFVRVLADGRVLFRSDPARCGPIIIPIRQS
jgi:hypothetical protein